MEILLENSDIIVNSPGFLEINYHKTCKCEENHLNCLTAKEWIKHQLGVWEFFYEKRDIRKKDLHPATYPISLATKCIKLFTHEGELVVDPFNGSGTTLLSAKDNNRNAVGFDINMNYCQLCESRLAQERIYAAKQITICDDARNINKYLPKDSISLCLTSPPYANLLNRKRLNKSRRNRKNDQFLQVEQYSQEPNDLGTLSIEDFSEELSKIYKGILPLMKPGGHVIVNVADMWWEGNRITIHMYVVEALRKAGYIFKNTIIWDRTNIVNQIGIFGWPSNYITMGTTFEYLLHFYRAKE